MITRLIACFCLCFFFNGAWSFPCYYTLVKDNCWADYDVSVDVIDSANLKKLLTLSLPKGTSWTTSEFNCTPAQGFIYMAKFSPVFWAADEGKQFRGLRNWTLPGTIKPTDVAWTIPICFTSDFADVPLPPDSKGNCKCDFTQVKPPKI